MLTSREDLLSGAPSTNIFHEHEEGHVSESATQDKEESYRNTAQPRDKYSGTAAGGNIRSNMETARDSTNKKCEPKSTIEHSGKIIMGEGREETANEANAATKIQAGFRGYQVRKQMKNKKPSPDNNKEVKRCSSGRRRSSGRTKEGPKSSDLEERSATKIQAGIRGFLVRKRQRNAKDKQA